MTRARSRPAQDVVLRAASGVFQFLPRAVEIGDPVVVVGFPGEWQGHQAVTREAKILDTKGPTGEEKCCSFPTASAGQFRRAVLDGSGNVIGVVVAKAELHTYDPDDNNREIRCANPTSPSAGRSCAILER